MTAKKPIGKILLRQRALRPDELDRALTERGEGRLASRLARQGTITDLAALAALSEQHGVPGVDLTESCVELSALSHVPHEIAEEYQLLPLSEREERLYVAMADPRDKGRLDELALATGKRVHAFVALESALSVAIERSYSAKGRGALYYVAPNCAEEHLAERGIDADGNPLASGEVRAEALTQESVVPGLVLDDGLTELASADEVDEPSFEAVREERAREDTAPRVGARRILLAIVDQDIRKLLVQLLSHSGQVYDAADGAQALESLRASRPDLVILDARLPDHLGFEIVRRMKQGEGTRYVPIILTGALSGTWQSAEHLKRTLGVELVLERPLRVAPVVSAAETFLREPPRPRESEAIRAREVGLALRAGSEAYRQGDLEGARAHLRRAVAIDPFGSGLHLQLGLVSARRGQIFDAIDALEAALAADGKHFSCLRSLAILHQKAGFRDLAVETWERALMLAPDEAARQGIRERLLKLL